MLWRGCPCHIWTRNNRPNKQPISLMFELVTAGAFRCGRASCHSGSGGEAGGVARWGTKAAPTCFLHLPPTSWLKSAGESKGCIVRISVLLSVTDRALPGAVGWLRSRACGVVVVAMEPQDKKQVSLFMLCTLIRSPGIHGIFLHFALALRAPSVGIRALSAPDSTMHCLSSTNRLCVSAEKQYVTQWREIANHCWINQIDPLWST